MSFFSEKDYLDKERGVGEMQLRQTAPLLSRPNSPERKLPKRLADIPEATPGPNAFALEAARLERYRLNTNAFYQEEVQRRKITPLTAMHPALRSRSNSDLPSPLRLSDCTTMSPFVNVGKENQHSPPLRLEPESSRAGEPTQRGYIEELSEHSMHERSGSQEERIPVFVPTPKMNSNSFEKPTKPGTSRTEKQQDTAITELPTKTPKKSILEKLRLTTNLLGFSSPAPSTHETVQDVTAGEKMPVKAKAVFGVSPSKSKPRTSLGSSPSKSILPRSPSKRKGFFSRKTSDMPLNNVSKEVTLRQSADIERGPPTASSYVKTPPTAFSDPTHYSYQGKRLASQTHFDQAAYKDKEANNCAVVRSQSLKYFDHAVPPTPPAKNTPPDVKARKEALERAMKSESSRVPFHDDQTTPSKSPTGVVSISDRISPAKFGGYGYREVATLVTRPSMYSLHASVVPNLTEASTFEEMKARIDGLGLEGFNMPPENKRSPDLNQGYTPSIYSTQFSPRPNSAMAKLSPATPQAPFLGHNPSTHTKSSSRNGEIPVFYPELAKDRSVINITPVTAVKGNDKPTKAKRSGFLDASIPFHGYTHSRDHSQSPRHSVDSLIFAHHVDDDLKEPSYDSPTSFSHASATPSPLQFLPTTTYTPLPSRRSSKRPLRPTQSAEASNTKITKDIGGLGLNTPARGASVSPQRRNGLFANAPTLPVQSSPATSRNASPQTSQRGMPLDSDTNIDPLKTSPARRPSGDKIDRMMDMLSQLRARNGEISTMREEMRVSNARLDERLSAVEGSYRGASPIPPSDESVDEWGTRGRGEQQRVSTNVAHDFYRLSPAEPECDEDDSAETEVSGSDTIATLMETNRRLLEMCGGFADKIKALEERVDRNA